MHASNPDSTLCRTMAVAAFVVLLSACTAAPMRLAEFAPQGGYVLHDENTTPRFWHRGRPADVIATLYTDGNNIFLDDRRVTINTPIRNGAHVRTGPDSGALVAFEPANRGRCHIEVRDISVGRLLGGTGECLYTLDTPQGGARAETRSTEYHVDVHQGRTELTILSGRMQVLLRSAPGRPVTVNAFQEVLLSADGIIGPRPVSAEEIKRRTQWQHKFSFRQKAPARFEFNFPIIKRSRSKPDPRPDDADQAPPADDQYRTKRIIN
ncbi:hypothetical protein [Marinobacterium sedimentorum]|uniref:hypothetical protein n=1 Tax=Marinobacterium sedimentorum TaxID=2927804 RepID=UPI0020C5BD94|nr:hypothetical protein [Marinobacterium sedimentorum]MCP8688865.1 hypothetical protein [Marinobacterium sedimentorum]